MEEDSVKIEAKALQEDAAQTSLPNRARPSNTGDVLLPCPFCGAKVDDVDEPLAPADLYSVNHSPDCFLFDGGQYVRIDRESWNTRIRSDDSNELRARIESLEGECKRRAAHEQGMLDQIAEQTEQIDELKSVKSRIVQLVRERVAKLANNGISEGNWHELESLPTEIESLDVTSEGTNYESEG